MLLPLHPIFHNKRAELQIYRRIHHKLYTVNRRQMATSLCPNVTSNENNYSDPVPVIGLYIAAGTMVCFLFILWDIIYAIRRRNTWFPCRKFSLNSVTLTLLAIAAKLPVDLTTPMPSSLDQFSKLTGTILICVSMTFLFPSLGVNRAPECMSNMAALSIFVITVIVNVCIQISTGLIVSFIPEHVISMFFMLILLCLLWGFTLYMNTEKEKWTQANEFVTAFGNDNPERYAVGESMLNRLKSCYLHAYSSNPQFVICKTVSSCISCVVSSVCLVIVLEAILRSLIKDGSRFLSGSSDYGWSMRMIVGSQILLILLGSLAACVRGVTMWNMWGKDTGLSFLTIWTEARRWKSECHPFLSFSVEDRLFDLLKLLVYSGYFFAVFLFGIPYEILCKKANKTMVSWCGIHMCDCDFLRRSRHFDGLDECRDLLPRDNKVDLWTLGKCWDDMKRLMRVNKSSSPSPLIQLLSNYPIRHRMYNVSSLHLVFLARIASVSLPSVGSSLTEIVKEVFDVIYFVDRRLHALHPTTRKRCRLAKALWMGNDFSILLPKISKRSQAQSDLEHAITTIKEIQTLTPSLCIWEEVHLVMNSIVRDDCRSVEQLKGNIEQLFADILYSFFIQLPDAIWKEVNASHVEDYDITVRFVLKLLCQMEPLDGKIRWHFPIESGITCMMTKDSSPGRHTNVARGDNVSNVVATPAGNVTVAQAIEDVDQIVHSADHDEIVQVD